MITNQGEVAMTGSRWILPLVVLSLGTVGWAIVDSRANERAERLGEEAAARRLGDALIREGIALYQKGDYAAAVSTWERYLKSAPANADTISIREMILEAHEAGIPNDAPTLK